MANLNKKQFYSTAILLFAIVPFGLCHINCDIGGCKILLQSTLSDLLSDGLESMCKVIEEVLKCVNDCHRIFFPHFTSTNSTVHFLNEICKGDFIYSITDENWKCIRQHFNRLITCVATSSSLEFPENKRDNSKLLSCKKVISILNCPQDVLYNQCDDEVIEIVNDAFQKGLKPLLETSCFKISSNKASNLNVQSSIDTEYQKMAACMDNYEDLSMNCFQEYLEKAAHSELNSCSENPESVCNKPASSISCSPLSFVGNFYSTIFSYGKQKCKNPPSDIYQLKPHTTSSTTEAVNMEIHVKIADEISPLMKDVIPNSFQPSTMETGPYPLLEFNTTTTLDDTDSTFNTVTDSSSMLDYDDLMHSSSSTILLNTVNDAETYSTNNIVTYSSSMLDYDNFKYSSSSTILPDTVKSEPVLSDAPQNNSNNISIEYHASCGTVFVSYTYIFLSFVAILL